LAYLLIYIYNTDLYIVFAAHKIIRPGEDVLTKVTQSDRRGHDQKLFKKRFRARLACKRLSKFVQRLTRLSNQTQPLSNLRCQRLESQLSAIERRFCWLTTPTKWHDLQMECVFSLHYSEILKIQGITVFEIQSEYLRHVRQTLTQLRHEKNYITNKCVGVHQ